MYNEIIDIIEKLDDLPDQQRQEVMSQLSPEHQEVIRQVRESRAMTNYITESLDTESVQFVGDDPEDNFEVGRDGKIRG